MVVVKQQRVDAKQKDSQEFRPVAVARIQAGRFRPEKQRAADEHGQRNRSASGLELLDDIRDRLFCHHGADESEIDDSDRAHRHRKAQHMGRFDQRKYISGLTNPRSDRRSWIYWQIVNKDIHEKSLGAEIT